MLLSVFLSEYLARGQNDDNRKEEGANIFSLVHQCPFWYIYNVESSIQGGGSERNPVISFEKVFLKIQSLYNIAYPPVRSSMVTDTHTH